MNTEIKPEIYTDQLTPDNAALLMLDHQTGIMQGVEDIAPAEFHNNILTLAKVGKIFNLPTIFTTSYADGPNGPLMKELTEIHPNSPVIHRPGQINAWHDPNFIAAV